MRRIGESYLGWRLEGDAEQNLFNPLISQQRTETVHPPDPRSIITYRR